jgi:membrane protease YdiL (CAAX protease family)
MNWKQVGAIIVSTVYALVFFGVVIGISMGLVQLNTNWLPDLVWFPVPVIALLVGAIAWAQRRWSIGLTSPGGVPWGRVYAFAFTITVVGLTVCILQGAYHGYVRLPEVTSGDVSPLFAVVYAFVMSVVAAILAEAAFRGIMQTRLQAFMSIWPVILIIGAVNTLAHRPGPELDQQWLGFIVTLAGWSYLRWLGQSLVPPLVVHGINNLLLTAALWYWGPLDYGALSARSLTVIAVIGVAALVSSIYIARSVNLQRQSPDQPT